nr:ribonuclease H-like domain-containing protein [Tanacetum cinerariifolium]
MEPPTYGSVGRNLIQIAIVYVLPGVLLVATAVFDTCITLRRCSQWHHHWCFNGFGVDEARRKSPKAEVSFYDRRFGIGYPICTRDLYPVTTPHFIPHAFLVSQHTCHQHLGHPGGEVLRHLVSLNFISYNKEKPPIPCHACQPGKHARLPFVSSSTAISSFFDIIHLDVWTSPILSLSVTRDSSGLFLSQKIYALNILDMAHMANCNPSRTPIDTESKLGSDGGPVSEPTLYRSLAGSLRYLTFIRLDFSYAVQQEFAMTDLGPLNYFLGISVTRDSSGLFLSQKIYALNILDMAHMANCNPSRTPIDTESKLGSDGGLVSEPTLYRSLAGSLRYLTFIRLDFSYAVQQ